MQADEEISWHRSQIAKNRELIEELLAGTTEGNNVFPETQAEIDRLKAQTAQSELIVAAMRRSAPAIEAGERSTTGDTTSRQNPNDREICPHIARAASVSLPSLSVLSVTTTPHKMTAAVKMPFTIFPHDLESIPQSYATKLTRSLRY